MGIVRGLAWTSVGGDTLEIEVNVMPGKGVLQLTGQMGDVMKESAQTALSYVRSAADQYGVKNSYFEKHDIHIHIPEGAVPKGWTFRRNYHGSCHDVSCDKPSGFS